MALQKTIADDDTGVAVSYWRIGNVAFPPGLNTAAVTVNGYADQAAAAAKTPVAQRRFVLGPVAYDAVFPPTAKVSEITARAYAWLKAQQAEFAGAADV